MSKPPSRPPPRRSKPREPAAEPPPTARAPVPGAAPDTGELDQEWDTADWEQDPDRKAAGQTSVAPVTKPAGPRARKQQDSTGQNAALRFHRTMPLGGELPPGEGKGSRPRLPPAPRERGPVPVVEPPPTRPNPARADTPFDFGLDLDESAGNDALDLVGRDPGPASIEPEGKEEQPDPLADLKERYALGDFSGALVLAEGVLASEPDNTDAQRFAESCRDVLKQMYSARLGAMSQVPTVAVPAEQLRWLSLDHRAGFLLSHVDGVSTLEDVLDVCGMPQLEAMRIIYELVQQKVIVLQ